MSLKHAARLFIRDDVQSILRSVTEFNPEKILKSRFNKDLRRSKLELLTEEQLLEVCV